MHGTVVLRTHSIPPSDGDARANGIGAGRRPADVESLKQKIERDLMTAPTEILPNATPQRRPAFPAALVTFRDLRRQFG